LGDGPGGFEINLGGGGGDSGGSSGGGSSSSSGGSSGSGSGSSSSGSSAPAPDPFFSNKIKAQKFSTFQSTYMSLWGEPATEDYLKNAVNQGMNVWEFAAQERHKPAYRQTKTYRDRGSDLAELLHGLGIA
jgi:hypothetical protein